MTLEDNRPAACASVSRVDAAEAIAELRELSTQIEAVVLASRDGELLASSLDSRTAVTVAGSAGSLVEGADAVRRDLGREALAQVQAATAEGSVFVVVDDDPMAIAVTAPTPPSGSSSTTSRRCCARPPSAPTSHATSAERRAEPEPAPPTQGDDDGEA